MQQIESLEQLLPNFEQFLEDLSTIKLTSDLERRVNSYKERIKLHIEKHSQQPGNVPPKLPDSFPPPLKRPNETNTEFLSRQRVIARETYSSSGGSAPQEEDDNIYELEDEDVYLQPSVTSPPVPTTNRPILGYNPRAELPKTPEENGGEDFYEFEASSGPQRVIDVEEEQLLYQDVEDDNYDDDFNSDSTDFEEVGEGGQVTSQIQPKQKKGKFDLFQEQFADDPQVDMIGELFYSDMSGTISTRLLNKWVKRYCVARDMHLLCHNAPNKGCSLDIPLPGHKVELRARTGGKKNVLVISHRSKGDQMYSCRSKEEAERWLEVLQDYATMGHEIEPNCGYIESAKEDKKAKEKIKKEKKKEKKREKKESRTLSTPQLSSDINGVLSGYINLCGVYFGDPKWKKHWISIKDHTFNCHVEANGTVLFQFDLRTASIDLAEEKQENAAMKIYSGDETYVLVEAVNMMDNGMLLKSLVAGISAGNKKDPKENNLISTLMAAFEKPKNDESAEPSFYENLRQGKTDRPTSLSPKSPEEESDEKPSSGKSDKSSGKKSAFSRFFKSNAPKDDSKSEASPNQSPSVQRKSATESEAKAKIESDAKTKAESDAKTNSEKRRLEKKISKVAPGQPNLVLASQLMEERTEKEARRKELNQKKKDLRLKKFSLKTDEERDKNDEELRAAQREWNEINNKLVDLDRQIFLAKNGNSEVTGEDDEYTNTYPIDVNRRESRRPESALVRRTSYMSRQSALEAGTITENEKVTTGTVKNMKSLFQGN